MHALDEAGRFTAPAPNEPRHWVENLRVNSLSIGTYSVPVGGADTQRPHTEDEVYGVMTGGARLVAGPGSMPVGPGSVIFMPAHEEHRFVDISEDLVVLVIFVPPEGSAA